MLVFFSIMHSGCRILVFFGICAFDKVGKQSDQGVSQKVYLLLSQILPRLRDPISIHDNQEPRDRAANIIRSRGIEGQPSQGSLEMTGYG